MFHRCIKCRVPKKKKKKKKLYQLKGVKGNKRHTQILTHDPHTSLIHPPTNFLPQHTLGIMY